MSKYKDDISSMMRGEKATPSEAPSEAPIEEAVKIREGRNVGKKDGMRYWGTPEHKIPPPAMTGEEEVRHRSGGKGGEGLAHEEKMEIFSVCHIIRSAVGEAEAMRLAFLVDEYRAKERKRIEEFRRKRLGTKYTDNWNTKRLNAIAQTAKGLRSV